MLVGKVGCGAARMKVVNEYLFFGGERDYSELKLLLRIGGMAKVVVRKFKTKSSKKRVSAKQFQVSKGKTTVVRVINAASRTLPSDIEYVFSENVRKARSENKKLGLRELVPQKG